jgi:hypothetical protein
MRLLALTLLLLIVLLSNSGEVNHAVVQYDQGIYTVDMDLIIDAEQSVVWTIVTDYDHLYRLSDTITESKILHNGPDIITTRIVTTSCILFFCFGTTLVENVQELDSTTIHTTIDASQSDFEFGTTQWQIMPFDKDRTHILYKSRRKPAFWVPPFIGPTWIKNKMLSETKKFMQQLEILAIHG